jgi:ferritin-like metal-binding protein YciE
METTMKLASLRDLLIDELRDCYHMEKQIVKALPKVIKNCTHDELREGLEEHLEETKGQVERIEQCFDLLDLSPNAKTCEGMKGILSEGEEMMSEDAEASLMDASIISACQKVEHYEIASYGTLCAWCDQLGLKKVGDLLKQNLAEEKAADQKLTQVAESVINKSAEQESEEMAHTGRGNGRRR